MPVSDVLAVGATGWGLLMGVAPALQIRRMFQTGSSRDVSLGYLGLLTPGFVLWLAYGISIGNGPVMITNTVSLTFMLITIGIAWSFRRRQGKAAGDAIAARPTPVGGTIEREAAAPRR
jgi:MtN3 and saliva related transmembrane protein